MKRVLDSIKNNILNDQSVVIAVSGGMDSILLLHLVLELKKEKNLRIIVAHVNHNLREESKEEALFVEKLCLENDIIFEYRIIKEYKKGNFHNEARKIRYSFFSELLEKYNSKYLLTAHHGDDLMETILMRILRGSNLKGYSGFKELSEVDNYNLFRPLIYLTKDDIIKYVKLFELDYREDNSNKKSIYTRNRIRKNILPLFKNEDENASLKFLNYSVKLNEALDCLEELISDSFYKCYVDKKIDFVVFDTYNMFIKKGVLNKILNEIYGDDINLVSDKHVDNILDICLKDSSFIDLPKGVKIYKNKNYLYFDVDISCGDYLINVDDCVCLEVLEECETDGNDICRINFDDVKLPLYIRNKKDGDKIEVKGLNGSKKIKDIFINEKIDLLERKKYPLLCDSNDVIIWLPGIKKSKICREKDGKYDIIFKYNYKEENNEFKRN